MRWEMRHQASWRWWQIDSVLMSWLYTLTNEDLAMLTTTTVHSTYCTLSDLQSVSIMDWSISSINLNFLPLLVTWITHNTHLRVSFLYLWSWIISQYVCHELFSEISEWLRWCLEFITKPIFLSEATSHNSIRYLYQSRWECCQG